MVRKGRTARSQRSSRLYRTGDSAPTQSESLHEVQTATPCLAWHRVLIPTSDVAKLGTGGLMDDFEKAYRVPGCRKELRSTTTKLMERTSFSFPHRRPPL